MSFQQVDMVQANVFVIVRLNIDQKIFDSLVQAQGNVFVIVGLKIISDKNT